MRCVCGDKELLTASAIHQCGFWERWPENNTWAILNLPDHTLTTGSWIVTAVLYHRVLTNTHKSFWLDAQDLLKSRAGIKQHCVGMSQACVFCVLPQQDSIELEQSHTLTCRRKHLGMCKIRCLLTPKYDFHLTTKHISTVQFIQ